MSKRSGGGKSQLSIGGFIVVLILAAIGYFFNGGDTAIAPPPEESADSSTNPTVSTDSSDSSEVTTTTGAAADWYEIYFTNPGSSCPPVEERHGGLDEVIAEDLLKAEVQVDIAAFEFNSEPLTEALIELEERGIPVRIVIDTDYEDEPEIRRLRRNGISVRTDDRSALMHNKFIVIDGRFTWIGSMNLTTNGVHCNNNNLVRIDSPRLAQNFIVELDEMYDERSFGPRSPENTPNEQLTIEGVRVENYFAPEKEVAPIIGELVNSAESEILFMAFSFTIDLVGEPMLDRAEEGVLVQGVFETTGSESEYSYYGEFLDSGLDNVQVRQDGNGRIMHHKVIIIDRETTLFGSFNFSNSANDSNDEVVIIIHDPVFTSFFIEEFEAVWGEAKQ